MNTLISLFKPGRMKRHAFARGAIVEVPTGSVAAAA